jgi:hypothetical protein
MFHDFTYSAVLAASRRSAWEIEDVLPAGVQLDFACPFMPEGLARTEALSGLSKAARLTLNHVRGHEYLSMFGLVEEFILPFVLDHLRGELTSDDEQIRALLQFAGEEAKHIHLFKRFHAAFVAGFGSPCAVIGPPQAIAAEVLRHSPLAVALLILHIEWMSQRHYLESVRDDRGIEPLFASLLRHHWMEEAQHAKLDMLIVEQLADRLDAAAIDCAIDEYLELGSFLDTGLKAQSELNLAALELATGRTLDSNSYDALLTDQHQALRWTYIGSGMTHPKFVAALAAISPAGAAKVSEAASHFC